MSYNNHTVVIKEQFSGELSSGTITQHSIDWQDPRCFIGEIMTIITQDENGMPVEQTGVLVEVLE